MTHRLDLKKFREELHKRGWKKDSVYNTWVAPTDKSAAELDQDWIIAVENSVVCVAGQVHQGGISA